MLRTARLIAVLAVTLLTAAGCTAPCEQSANWQNTASTACTSCVHTNCSEDQNQVAAVALSCASEYLCAAGCSGRQRCDCLDRCLTTDTCKRPFMELLSCSVSFCDSSCR